MLPINIKKEDVLRAIDKINTEGVPNGADSEFYDVLFNGSRYPPKLLISWANIFANNIELSRDSFEGGINTESFKVLDKEGFEIVNKKTGEPIFFEQLIKFLNQANIEDLKTAIYTKQYRGLRVKVSFGQGNKSDVPWIALLRDGEKVQEGIYPVYLYSIEKKLLILAYGVSETKPPKNQWNLDKPRETIKQYFERVYQSNPFRYGHSYVFKTYNLNTSISFGLNYTTVISDLDELINEYVNNPTQTITADLENSNKISKRMENYHLNTILYGPPGTGKTYNSIRIALKLLGENLDGLDQNDITKLFSKKIQEGRIVFTTFHQSMSYEDFIEGIKPKTEDQKVIYEIEEGIFKLLCNKARPTTGNFEEVIELFKNEISESDGKTPLTITSKATKFDVIYRGTNVFYVQPHNSVKENPWYPVNILNVRKAFESGQSEGIYNPTYVREIIAYLVSQKGLRKGGKEDNNEPYVLIIDEINRGNIAAIFGELITLIEESKRLGKPDELEVILPYSKERFGVPSNIYILGTMNTADRSVESLDTALRRRFDFVEMPPLYSVDALNREIEGVNLAELLFTINNRIEKLLSKDSLIGHSYFIIANSLNDLKSIFHRNIIPLLQEYFYGDFGKIGLVIGKEFFEKSGEQEGNEDTLFADFTNDSTTELLSKPVYRLLDATKMNDSIFQSAIKNLLNKKVAS